MSPIPSLSPQRQAQIAVAVAGALGVAYPAMTFTDVASEPLAQAASNVRPNIMFILDDSGSMDWDYSPDYVNDGTGSGAAPSTTGGCFDSGDAATSPAGDFDDADGSIAGRLDTCYIGDPPYMSPDFNKQYYNPAILYRPGVNADGTERPQQNAANTSNWTQVRTDSYNVQNRNQLGTTMTFANIVTGYPDRVWCRNYGDAIGSANCRTNSAYLYPDREFSRGRTGLSGAIKYTTGAPYYYRAQTAQWCDVTLTNCRSGSNINPPASFPVQAGEFCTDEELTNCAAGAAVTAAHVYSGIRFCSDQNTLASCQRKKIPPFIWPKHAGTVLTAANTGTQASAMINITQSQNNARITGFTINGASLINPGSLPYVVPTTSTTTLAANLRGLINAHTGTSGYSAGGTGAQVVLTFNTQTSAVNGHAVVLTSPLQGVTAATGGRIDVATNATASSQTVTAVTAGTPARALLSPTCAGSFGNGVTASGGVILAATGTNSNAKRDSLRDAIAFCINAHTATSGFSASTASNGRVNVSGTTATGAQGNGTLSVTRSGGITLTTVNPSGGVSAQVLSSSPTTMAGGSIPTVALPTRVGVGVFTRIDIVSTTTSYPKASGRTDCAGATCTYAEEMTNFANWYTYARTRMQMMKTAAGRAFLPIDDNYRVGFITINPGSPVAASRYLRIQDFTTAHRANWYTRFYSTVPSGGTPLREALSRVGRLFAGQFDGINNGIPSADDPVQYSCQPNFAILSTDGYWTTATSPWSGAANQGWRIDMTPMTQQDNVNAGLSLRADGVFDGAAAPTVGLADVAQYYYATDLRPGMPDNVPTTQRDRAQWQHMVTFTLGLGLDGILTYRRDYESATTGDFVRIKQGLLDWPNPVADSPAALDDLWHAAVNGRGVFFSASNPQELAVSLSETLEQMRQRVGAGAAAATSNLQPVAGDNFAFTAQYQTQTWTGDLRARTIDLNTGIVSQVALWSAAERLDARAWTGRVIYTFDATDSGPTGNRLKHFCWPGAGGATCSDGSGLTAAEQALFNPNLLPQWGALDPGQRANATAQALVNFLRGDASLEDTGGLGPTDVFRQRLSVLGDIVNAQPSYVRVSPFNYADPGYQEFRRCTQGVGTGCPATQFPNPAQPRRPTVYIAANDGMLRAIETDVNNDPYFQIGGIATLTTTDDTFSTGNNAGNGEERWAYIPGMALDGLRTLAAIPYNHRYFTDGSPTVGDVCLSTPCSGLADWRTILVAGMNAGGRGFYALDITNPLAPRALWEFTVRKPSVTACAATPALAIGASDDCDLGLSFGNPVITKRKSDGRWVVIVTSGVNNAGREPGTSLRQGDGQGYLYVLDAATGTILHKIGTGAGSGGTVGANYTDAQPSGLTRINNWVENALVDNSTLAVYGGDLLGNLWRFDLDPASSTHLTAVRVAEVRTSGGLAQPITVKPELEEIAFRRVVLFGTGRYWGHSDKTDFTQQTIYAISDDTLTNSTQTGRPGLVQQTLTTLSSTERTITSPGSVAWGDTTVRGWFIDLPDAGERVNVDPQLQLGTLVMASNVPSNDACVAGGYSWVNNIDPVRGAVVVGATNNRASERIGASVTVGLNVVQLPGGKVVTIVTTADNQQLTYEAPVAPSSFQGRRVSWRELLSDQ